MSVFTSLRGMRDDPMDSFILAKTKNNLAILLKENDRYAEAVTVYNEAIVLMRDLINGQPENRRYREVLAMTYNNLGNLHLMQSDPELALDANSEARLLFEALATPVYGLRNEIANSHNTRGRILTDLNRTEEAAKAYETALQHFAQLERDTADFSKDPDLNERYGHALAQLAILHAKERRFDTAVKLVSQAIEYYIIAVNSPALSTSYKRSLSKAYWLLADTQLKSGNYIEAVKSTEALAESTTDKELIYRSVILYSSATGLALTDIALTASERSNIGESYMERTVSLLGTAIAAGYPLERVEADVDRKFDHLRYREDFRRLLSDASETQKQ